MHVVDRAAQYPAYCFWTFKTGDELGPCLDLERDFDERCDGRMYLSLTAARTFGEAAGMVRPEVHEALHSSLETAEHEIAELKAQIADLDKFTKAIDVIESADFRARKRAGRPKKEPQNA